MSTPRGSRNPSRLSRRLTWRGAVRVQGRVIRSGPLRGLDEQERVERARLHVPVDGAAALHGLCDRTGRALAVAAACGAPVGPILAAAGDVAAQRARTAAELERVVRPAVGIARSLVALPVVVVPLLAVVLDLDLWGFWTGDPFGRGVGLVVVAMVGAAAAWLRAMVWSATRVRQRSPGRPRAVGSGAVGVGVAAVAAWFLLGWVAAGAVGGVAWWIRRRADEPEVAVGLDEVADLAAIAVAAGLDLPAALRQAAAQVPDAVLAGRVAGLALRVSLEPPSAHVAPAWLDHHPAIAPLARLVWDVTVTGQPAVDPLRRLAVRLRRREADRVRVAVARLPARLTLPTTLLLVPATVLAVGAPVALRGLQAVTGP